MSGDEQAEDESDTPGVTMLNLKLVSRRPPGAVRGCDIDILVLDERGEVMGKLRRCRIISIEPITRKAPLVATFEVIGPEIEIEAVGVRVPETLITERKETP